VRAVFRSAQRRATTLIDAQRERTILVVGDRLVPLSTHIQEYALLAQCDAVYVTGCDAEVLHDARRARVLTATSRVLPLLQQAKVRLDALVGSANDPDERYAAGDLDPAPMLVVRTDGARGGTYEIAGATHRYAPVPTTITGDTYGAGDTFAAALTYALGEGKSPDEATAFAAARAAEVLAFRGPYP
jgi:ribokinase